MGLIENNVQTLVAAAQAGDQDSFGQLYELFSQRVYRFIAFRVSTREEAEDLAQSVWLETIRALPRYKKQQAAKFSTWLFQIARFTLIDHYRAKRETIPIDDLVGSESELLRSEPPPVHFDARTAKVQQFMKQLPEKYQTVLHLTFVEDMSPREISGVMRVTVIAVRVWKHRALKKLHAVMQVG